MRPLPVFKAPRTAQFIRGAALAALLGAFAGCLPQMQAYNAMMNPQQSYAASVQQSHDAVDAQMVKTVEDARAKSQAAPGSSEEALRWSGALEAAYGAGTVERGKLDGAAETKALGDALDAAAVKTPKDKPELLAAWGRVLLLAGNQEEAIKKLDESIKIRPNLSALGPRIELLDKEGKHAEVGPLCKKTRPNVKDDDERYYLLDKCLKHSGQTSVDAGLAWAGAADIKYYNDEQAKAQERALERERERQARADQMRAESNARQAQSDAARSGGSGSSGGGGSASSAPIPTSVEVRSECGKTVPVFYGEKPKFGSGTRSSVSSNSISNAPRKADGTLTIWIIDESENGIASARVSPSTRRVVIDRSCTSIRAD